MCRRFLFLCLLLVELSGSANALQYAYQVNFWNKNGTRPFSDSSVFLTSRSLARRSAQGIVLDSTDLPVTKAYVDSVLSLTGGTLHITSKWLNLCVILVTDTSRMSALNGIAFVKSKKMVAAYSTILHKGGFDSDGDEAASTPAYKTTSGAAYYANTWDQTNMVNGYHLHDLGYKGQGKLIAVVDAGYYGTNTHPAFDSLRTSGRIVDERNFTLASNSVYAYDTHGTEVLSTMAGYVPNTYVGSAPLASYALYIGEDNNSEQPIELFNLLAATERADSIGADIVTTSLGYNTFDNSSFDLVFSRDLDGKTTPAAIGANMATQKGMLFVSSAGNEGGNSWNMILTPGDADSALTIGSVDISGNCASTSGYGPNAAGRVKPDACTLGQPGAVASAAGGFGSNSGTSIATPEIAGWAACLWQGASNVTTGQLRRAIIKCASRFTSPGTQIGYGIPNFRCAAIQLEVIDNQQPPISEFNIIIANPVTQSLNIIVNLQSPGEVTFSLCDITGKEVVGFRGQFGNGRNPITQYDVSYLPTGVYVLRSIANGHRSNTRIVKQ